MLNTFSDVTEWLLPHSPRPTLSASSQSSMSDSPQIPSFLKTEFATHSAFANPSLLTINPSFLSCSPHRHHHHLSLNKVSTLSVIMKKLALSWLFAIIVLPLVQSASDERYHEPCSDAKLKKTPICDTSLSPSVNAHTIPLSPYPHLLNSTSFPMSTHSHTHRCFHRRHFK